MLVAAGKLIISAVIHQIVAIKRDETQPGAFEGPLRALVRLIRERDDPCDRVGAEQMVDNSVERLGSDSLTPVFGRERKPDFGR